MNPCDITAKQIGGGAFMMLGAWNLCGTDKGKTLTFRIKGSRRVNYIKVTLTDMDTYTMEFGKVKKFDYDVVRVCQNIYADQLHETIEAETGLYTRL